MQVWLGLDADMIKAKLFPKPARMDANVVNEILGEEGEKHSLCEAEGTRQENSKYKEMQWVLHKKMFQNFNCFPLSMKEGITLQIVIGTCNNDFTVKSLLCSAEHLEMFMCRHWAAVDNN